MDCMVKWITGDYARLWQWACSPERIRPIPLYVDYNYLYNDGTKDRDICHLRNIKHGFGARGIAYSTYYVYLPENPDYAYKIFMLDCKSLNVEWLDESVPSPEPN